jgi:hypothetical protein
VSVYFIHAPETGLLKIGFAKDPLQRLMKAQVDSPTRLILVAVEEGDAVVEAARHAQFADLRVRGEWFRFEGEVADFVASLPPYVRPTKRAGDGPLGVWIRRNGLTLTRFADIVGTSEASLSRICAGKQFPSREIMLRIVEATNWEVDANALLSIPARPRSSSAARAVPARSVVGAPSNCPSGARP